jgi:hypothetical protein
MLCRWRAPIARPYAQDLRNRRPTFRLSSPAPTRLQAKPIFRLCSYDDRGREMPMARGDDRSAGFISTYVLYGRRFGSHVIRVSCAGCTPPISRDVPGFPRLGTMRPCAEPLGQWAPSPDATAQRHPPEGGAFFVNG